LAGVYSRPTAHSNIHEENDRPPPPTGGEPMVSQNNSETYSEPQPC